LNQKYKEVERFTPLNLANPPAGGGAEQFNRVKSYKVKSHKFMKK